MAYHPRSNIFTALIHPFQEFSSTTIDFHRNFFNIDFSLKQSCPAPLLPKLGFIAAHSFVLTDMAVLSRLSPPIELLRYVQVRL